MHGLSLIFLALMAWGGWLALGAYLGPPERIPTNEAEIGDDPKSAELEKAEAKYLEHRKYDYRKPLVVMAMALFFLGFWWVMLMLRQRKID